MSDEQQVLTEVQGNVLIVTINRPEAKNAMTKAAAEGIVGSVAMGPGGPVPALGGELLLPEAL